MCICTCGHVLSNVPIEALLDVSLRSKQFGLHYIVLLMFLHLNRCVLWLVSERASFKIFKIILAKMTENCLDIVAVYVTILGSLFFIHRIENFLTVI